MSFEDWNNKSRIAKCFGDYQFGKNLLLWRYVTEIGIMYLSEYVEKLSILMEMLE
jgi:hypothetical protein